MRRDGALYFVYIIKDYINLAEICQILGKKLSNVMNTSKLRYFRCNLFLTRVQLFKNSDFYQIAVVLNLAYYYLN